MNERRLRAASALTAALLLPLTAACGGDGISTPSVAAQPSALELTVEYTGCARLFVTEPSPTCVLSADDELRVWVQTASDAGLTAEAGGVRQAPAAAEPIAGGWLFRWPGLQQSLADPAEVTVRARRGEATAAWSLRLRPPEPLEVELRRLVEGGRTDAVRDLLVTRAAAPAAGAPAAAERAEALSSLARFRYGEGDFTEVQRLLEESVALHRAQGDVGSSIDDQTFFFHLLFYQRGELVAARRLLDQVPDPPPGHADSAYLADYYRGLWELNTGNPRAALYHLGVAARQAERLGLGRLRNMAEQMLASQLRQLGRHAEAAALLARLEGEAGELDGPCERAQLLDNVAWDQLLALEAGVAVDNPLPRLRQALDVAAGCDDVDERVNLEINVALAALHAGDLAAVRRHLERARQLTPQLKLWHLVWWHDVAARLALREGRLEQALAFYDELARLAGDSLSPDAAWRATVGRARVLAAAGERAAARAAFAEAEALLDRESLQAPLDRGRETAVAAREGGTRQYLDLLLADGRCVEALAVARRARSRIVRGLLIATRLQALPVEAQARWVGLVDAYEAGRQALDAGVAEDWRLPGDQLADRRREREAQRRELVRLLDRAVALLDVAGVGPELLGEPPPPGPGELLLAYHPLPAGWVGLAAVAGPEGASPGCVARRLPGLAPHLAGDPPALARELLEPFRTELTAAGQVRVLPYGFLHAVDFHALPWDGDVLLSAAAVVYGLDLPRTTLSEAAGEGRAALLVADPSRTLTAALGREVPAVQRALGEGWRVTLLAGGDATVAAVRDALPAVDLLHFAGHADFGGAGAGELVAGDLLDGGLWLAGGARLTVGEVLTRQRVPASVVLSACRSVRPSPAAPAGLGLAPAFLLAGGRQVIGAVREVDDAATAALVAELYREWDGVAPAAPALRRAQLTLRRHRAEADWASFRVLER